MDFIATEPAAASLDQVLAPAEPHLSFGKNGAIQFFPPQIVEWNRLRLPFDHWPAALDGLRILHLSDFHLRRYWPPVLDAVLRQINDNPPDLLLITGDFVDNKRNHRPAMPQVRRLIAGLKSRLGCFAIHGNHDSYKIGQELGGANVTFLDGRRITLQTPRGPIEIIGLPGRHRIELTGRFLTALPPRQPALPRIVLSHFPDHLKCTGGLNADLFLAGHTHGGQICLPGGKPIIWHDALPRKLSRGAHKVENTWLLVSRGLGFTGLPLRTFSTPEVVEIHCACEAGGAG
jgi:hypothetical protein